MLTLDSVRVSRRRLIVRSGVLSLLSLLLPVATTSGQETATKLATESIPDGLTRREWEIEGTKREALLHIPPAAKSGPTPMVFAFHGHGGGMRQASISFGYHQEWPEAIIVYMQGLNTKSPLVDPEGKQSGWQIIAGTDNNRDLKFFDEVLKTLRSELKVDERRVYVTGHSNGGGFTYLLWRERPEVFAAAAPSAMAGQRAAWTTAVEALPPKPAMHVAGRNDELIKFEWQQKGIEALKKANGCEGEGQPWGEFCTLYPSPKGTPVVTFIHPGTHKFPKEAPAAIVRFFKAYPKPETTTAARVGQ